MTVFVRLGYSYNEEQKAALMHYGVKGMKWGVRKDRRGSGGGPGAAKPKVSQYEFTPETLSQRDAIFEKAVLCNFSSARERGAKRLSDLPKIIGSNDIDDKLRAANPLYKTDTDAYTKNCTLAAIAYEARSRRFDVEAIAYTEDLDSDGPPASNVLNLFLTSRIFESPPPIMQVDAGGAVEAITEQFRQWGEGSRGIVHMEHEDGLAHAFNVEVSGGKVRFVDAQDGSHNMSKFLSEAVGAVKFMRTDNADFSEHILDVVKPRR